MAIDTNLSVTATNVFDLNETADSLSAKDDFDTLVNFKIETKTKVETDNFDAPVDFKLDTKTKVEADDFDAPVDFKINPKVDNSKLEPTKEDIDNFNASTSASVNFKFGADKDENSLVNFLDPNFTPLPNSPLAPIAEQRDNFIADSFEFNFTAATNIYNDPQFENDWLEDEALFTDVEYADAPLEESSWISNTWSSVTEWFSPDSTSFSEGEQDGLFQRGRTNSSLDDVSWTSIHLKNEIGLPLTSKEQEAADYNKGYQAGLEASDLELYWD